VAGQGIDPLQIVYLVLLGFTLSTVAGLRAFLPLLALGLFVRTGAVQLAPGSGWEWVASDTALIVLTLAVVFELLVDKVPALDHLQDAWLTAVKPVAGFILTAVPVSRIDPILAVVLGLVAGATAATAVHLTKGSTRLASTALTFGLANPALSFLEDLVALIATLLAWLVPVVIGVVAIYFALLAVRALIARWRGEGGKPAVPL